MLTVAEQDGHESAERRQSHARFRRAHARRSAEDRREVLRQHFGDERLLLEAHLGRPLDGELEVGCAGGPGRGAAALLA